MSPRTSPLTLTRRLLALVALICLAAALPSTWASLDTRAVADRLEQLSPVQSPLIAPFVGTAAQMTADRIADRSAGDRRGYRVLSPLALALYLAAMVAAAIAAARRRSARPVVVLLLAAGLSVAVLIVERLTADRPLVARALEVLGVQAFTPTAWPFVVLISSALLVGAAIAGAAELTASAEQPPAGGASAA